MRQMEMEEEVIDLSELLRLLWSHVLQICLLYTSPSPRD
mgnify:CR=1 FL=1